MTTIASEASGSRPSSVCAPPGVVRTIAPASSAGCSTSSRPLAVRNATSGRSLFPSRRRSSANASAAGGYARSADHVALREACIVPAPTTTTSAQARSSPITNRSDSLSSAISLFDCGSDGSATIPSIVSTKLAKSVGPSKPSEPS